MTAMRSARRRRTTLSSAVQVAPLTPDYVLGAGDPRSGARRIRVPATTIRFRSLVLSVGVCSLGLTVALRANDGTRSAGSAATVSAERVASQPFLASYTRPASTPFPDDNAFTPEREALG